MDVARKRRLAAMAVALEESAEDEEESGLLQCKRAVWVKPWLTKKSLGMQNQLYEELLASDPEQYKRLLRLDIEQFHHLLALIEPKIVRQDTVMRSSVPAKTRLQVMLRFLASGAGTTEQSSESVLQDTFFPVQPVRGSRFKGAASALRDGLCDYFNGEGAVPWQDDKAFADPTKHRRPPK
ncbi:hypothetical protein HPB50_014025 [Hyalomma asiaticum]|uniref:Uncharacterized protein n=1 Tax=Hyalomma asiaticum TaxID=266040 RepID=A0ACB7T7G1_HYAAI|nr:hypothetical protein HPB50_014025 [Hyalomma asiaticum]